MIVLLSSFFRVWIMRSSKCIVIRIGMPSIVRRRIFEEVWMAGVCVSHRLRLFRDFHLEFVVTWL